MLVMLHLPRPYRRLLVLILSLPVTLFVLAVLYQAGMQHFEGQARSLLASLLGQESVSLDVATKLVATSGVSLTGRPLDAIRVRELTGCLVVAVERGDGVIVEFDPDFEVQPDDTVYITGTPAGSPFTSRVFPTRV